MHAKDVRERRGCIQFDGLTQTLMSIALFLEIQYWAAKGQFFLRGGGSCT